MAPAGSCGARRGSIVVADRADSVVVSDCAVVIIGMLGPQELAELGRKAAARRAAFSIRPPRRRTSS
jgi:hypothetical protein